MNGEPSWTAEGIWERSRAAYEHGNVRIAKLLKAVNFHLNHALLPYQAKVGKRVRLGHHGMGVVIHPNTVIGDDVMIWHSVTIAAETEPGSDVFVSIGAGVDIGAGAIIIARQGQGLTVGNLARIGAGAVVTKDVPAGATVVGARARQL